jgi:hypothetical protein
MIIVIGTTLLLCTPSLRGVASLRFMRRRHPVRGGGPVVVVII